MNTAEIGAYIKNPQRLGNDQVEDLKNLCETHPYSGLAHLLYLKALGNAKSVNFDAQLKHFAIKIPNRELLYYLIHDEISADKPNAAFIAEATVFETHENDIVEDNEPTAQPDLVPEQAQEIATEEQKSEYTDSLGAEKLTTEQSELTEAIEEPVEESSVENNELEPEGISEEPTRTPIEERNESRIEEQIEEVLESKEMTFGGGFVESPFEEVSWLDNTITFEGFTDSQGNESEDDEEYEADPLTFYVDVLHEETISNETDLTDVSVDLDLNHTSNENHELETEKEAQYTNQRKSFYDWLNTSNAKKKNTTSETIEANNNIIDAAPVDSTTIESRQPVSIPEKSKEKTQLLVDKFIETEPRMPRPKAEFFSPVKSAKESVKEEGIPVSETLAKIYELQGNYPKAIGVFEKLIELLPNKREIFETKIAEIKAKMAG